MMMMMMIIIIIIIIIIIMIIRYCHNFCHTQNQNLGMVGLHHPLLQVEPPLREAALIPPPSPPSPYMTPPTIISFNPAALVYTQAR